MTISIQDNFLPEDYFYQFASGCMSNHLYMPSDSVTDDSERDGSIDSFGENLTPVDQKSFAEVMFQSTLFRRLASTCETQDLFNCYGFFFKEIEKLLNVKRWWMVRINCTIGQTKKHIGKYHMDYEIPYFKNTKTSILYLNSNNGGTKFRENNQFVQSKKNRLVTFPTHTDHAGVWATDAKLRYVLNMTYETK